MNIILLKDMIDRYNAIAYTHDYIFGFIQNGNVYACFCKSDVMPYVLKIDKASKGNGMSLRFKPTKAQKEFLKAHSHCFVICSEKYFNEMFSSSKYNRGDTFERICAEYFGQEWSRNDIPFTQGADLTANGIDYQVKFFAATFCHEKSLSHLG